MREQKTTPTPQTATQVSPKVFAVCWTLSFSLSEAVRVLQEFDPTITEIEILDTVEEYREAGVRLKTLT